MSTPSKALVVKLSSLGDLFHPLPAVHRLKQELNLSVDWITQPEYADLVACFDDVEQVRIFPRNRLVRSAGAWLSVLRAEQYDYLFDFQGLFKSGFVSRLARARRRIGPSWQREGTRVFYDEVAGTRNKNRHAVDEALDFARHFDLSPDPVCFPVTFPGSDRTEPSPRIAYLPCSRWQTKNWPAAHFKRLIDSVHRQIGGTPFLLGSPEDAAVCEDIERAVDAPIENLCGKTDLVGLGRVLQGMDLLVTVDSGPMHMAAAIGTPVVALFGATDPARTGPYGDAHRVIQHGDLPCQPCRSRTCLRPERDIACLRDLAPEQVAATVLAPFRPTV